MPIDIVEALSDQHLLFASSKTVFDRGLNFAVTGDIRGFTRDDEKTPSVEALTEGSRSYFTEVWIDAAPHVGAGEVNGACECPAGLEGSFCKHQVALALLWRDQLTGQDSIRETLAQREALASAKRAKSVGTRRETLLTFLKGQTAEVLAARLLDLAERNPQIGRELQQWRKLTEAQNDGTRLKSLITDLLSIRAQYISPRDTGTYTRRAAGVLPILAEATTRDAKAALGLAAHALRRSWITLENIDDSDAEFSDLCSEIGDHWVAALKAAGVQPAAFAETYLNLILEDPIGSIDTAAAEASMGDAARTRYHELVANRWRAALAALEKGNADLAARGVKGQTESEEAREKIEWNLLRLENLYLDQLEAAGDIEGALAVMRIDLSQPYNYSRITKFLEAHGRYREALANAEAACKAMPDNWGLEDDLLRCYERDGWSVEALQLEKRRFEVRPTVETYHAVLRAASAAGEDVASLREALMRDLVDRENKELASPFPEQRFTPRADASMKGLRNVTLRTEILGSEGRWGEALALVQQPVVCDVKVLESVALHLDDAQRDSSVKILMQLFERAMERASSPYRHELFLVAEIAKRLDPEPRKRWLSDLGRKHKAKRNFIRDLPF